MAKSWLPTLFKKKKKRVVTVPRKRAKLKRIAKLNKAKTKAEKKKLLVSDLMTRKIISVSPSTTLDKVVEIFLSNNISGAPVLDNDFFVGEISKTDILRLVKKTNLDELTEGDDVILKKNSVEGFMKTPICIRDNRTVEEAKRKMEKNNINRLLVLDKKNQLAGVISRTDLLKAASKEKIKGNVSTKIDEMLRLVEKNPTDFSKLSKILKVPENAIEEWAKILEEHGLVEISYPAIGSPVLKQKTAKTQG